MRNYAGRGTLAALVTTATYKQTASGWNQIKYTTEDEHNFKVGQLVTISGITGGTSANVSNLTVVNTPSVKSFVVSAGNGNTFVTATSPVVGSGVTAFASNGWSNSYEILYATPETASAFPFYFDISPNIQASAISPYPSDGTVSVSLNWYSTGGSNPSSAYKITQTVGTSTTDVVATASAVGSTTVTGLSADTIYSFTVVASNATNTTSRSTSISVSKQISAMGAVTSVPTASTELSMDVSWVQPNVASPAVAYYEIQQAISSDNTIWGSWTAVGTTPSLSTTVTGLLDTFYYKYRVRAFNGGYNNYVESASNRAYYLTTPTPTPTLESVAPDKTDIRINTSGFISNPTITAWTVQRSTNGTTWSTVATTATLPYVDDSGLANETTYYYRLRATNGQLTSAYSSSVSILTNPPVVFVEYLVLAGGGGGAGGSYSSSWEYSGGGGGAGGYRCNKQSETSGGGATAESSFYAVKGSTHEISIGSGGPAGTGSSGGNGNNSKFSTITALGGGAGGGNSYGRVGGSGGGAGGSLVSTWAGGAGTSGQGYGGGPSGNAYGAGGGGAGGPGTPSEVASYSKGGRGVQSSITGTLTAYAGGGSGRQANGVYEPPGSNPAGGWTPESGTTIYYGGGYGTYNANAGSGVNGLGAGGGGSTSSYTSSGGNGGSGVVVIAYPNTYPDLVITGSLTHDRPTRSGYKVYRFTAGLGSVTFNVQLPIFKTRVV